MRVLQINSVCGVGSTGRIATDIHNILINKGHESFIAYGRGNPKNCETAIRIGTIWDNYVHAGLTRIFDQHGFGSINATKKFLKAIEVLNPDVIHLHNIHGYYINIELLFQYLKQMGKPVVWTLHDCWAFTGHCSHFDYVGCDKWKTKCFHCPQKKEYPASMLLDNSTNNFIRKKNVFTGIQNMTLVTPSKWLAGLVKESFLGEYSVEVINNGIDLSVFKPTESDFRENNDLEGKFVILGVANVWGKRKGFKYFIKLAENLREDEVIVLVGLTEHQKRKLPKKILGITRTDSVQELAEIYSAADVFVNPTLEDNFPTTNLEALACGTPVITFNTGGSVESVDFDTGTIVDKGDIEELLNKIHSVRQRGRSYYTSEAIKRAKKLYKKEERFNEYLDLYSRVYG